MAALVKVRLRIALSSPDTAASLRQPYRSIKISYNLPGGGCSQRLQLLLCIHARDAAN
ncbi:hypothetical protein ACP_1506 [Acidobacterium capsulatum ATCC 51196]|uniref:Uncharacterized protein n=1 Tax=Acidobacterium capsulatum (strain ATCC 51196 / DSM 11244 / BCRC 80197 / JCM 7670 / NBRC 15755 / NCIMB 13165 / 161) TaxID=240015 RepID=C1F6K3_ACIC5|nr:hypothetical protein ACP_1506 [Acidobacterium capsulatum ATCC 51196]